MIKTLYERFGASGKFEAVGYYCNRCSIFYPKNAPSQPARTVYENEQTCIQSKAGLYTENANVGQVEPIPALMRHMGPAGFEPATSSARGWHPTKLDNGPTTGRDSEYNPYYNH